MSNQQLSNPVQPIREEDRPASRGAFGMQGRPLIRPRRPGKAAIMSPEARRILEERNRQIIDAAIQAGKVTKYDARPSPAMSWAPPEP